MLTTFTDYLSALSPMVWTCGLAIVLVVVVIKVLIMPNLDD